MSHDPFLPGQIADPARINGLDAQGTYTPVLTASTTNPNLGGSGSAVGTYWLSGHWVQGFARFLFLGTGVSGGSGVVHITVPFPPDLEYIDLNPFDTVSLTIGYGWIRDDTAGGNSQIVTCQFRDFEDVARIQLRQVGTDTGVADGSPFTFGTGDRIAVAFGYQAAL